MSKNTGTSELINYFDLGVNGDVGIAGSLDINTIANATTDTDTFLVSDTGIIKYRTGAQLLSDIGAAPAVAGGYVPYTGATTNVDLGVYNLTTSAIIANGSGSNSGIVHLESNAIHSLVNGYGSIASGTTNQFNLYQTTGAGVFRGAILSLNSITEFATRTFTLPDADGTIALTSNIPANAVGGTGTTNYLPKFTGASTIGNSATQTDATGNLMVGSANAGNAGTINVSVGVAGATAGGIQLWAATNQTHYIQFGDGTTGAQVYAGYLGYAHSTDSLLFGTNGADKMTLFSTGNLLVGTGSDTGERLQVSGNIKTNSGYIQIVNATNPSLYINNTAVQWQYYLKSNYNIAFSDAVRDVLTLGYNGSPSFFQGGNVGIGTASPSRRLVVVGGNGNQLELDNTGQTFTQQFWKINGVETGSIWASTSEFHMYTYGSQNINFSTNTASRMRITLDGTIAFNGNSTPNSGGLDKLSLGFADGAYGWIQTWGGRALSLNSQGNNVLIGTTTDAGYKLDVAGTGRFIGPNVSNRGQLSIQSNNASNAARASWYYDTTLQGNIGTTSGDFYVEAVNNLQLLAGGNISMGTQSVTSFSKPFGGQLIGIPNAVIVSGIIALGSPYTQNIQIDIVYNNWGGNNVIGLVDMIITLREFANIAGTAFGKIFAVNGGSGATFTSFNTSDVTTSQCTVTATSGGNYTLRITIDPSNITDRGSYYLVIPNSGGTGSAINSVNVSFV